MYCRTLLFALAVSSLAPTDGLLIIGCPLFGCRPSGTFSFSLKVPKVNASISWVSSFPCSSIPRPLGCVGNDVNIVCQSNGLGVYDTGYVCIESANGSVKWRDEVLQYPTLPMMDNYGDTIGSDGIDLIRYETDGKLDPIIHLFPPMKTIFSMQLVGTEFLLMVSETGAISTRVTNGIPVAEIFLTGTVERSNGSFIPVAQPVVNGNRLYVLTEFIPDNAPHGTLNMQRLYAIDVHDRMTDIMTVAWYFNFQLEKNPDEVADTRLRFRPRVTKSKFIRKLRTRSASMEPSLLWNQRAQTVVVILPPPLMLETGGMTSFWGIRDRGNMSTPVFHSLTEYTHMAMYEANTGSDVNEKGPMADPVLWTIKSNGVFTALKDDGSVDKAFDLSQILKTNVTVTSKLMTVRERDYDEDMLVFGIKVNQVTPQFTAVSKTFGVGEVNATAFVVAIDTPLNSALSMPLMWMLPTPNDTVVTGQIVGVPGADLDMKDQLVVFSQTEGKFAKFFAIH